MSFSVARSLVTCSAKLLTTARNGSHIVGGRLGAVMCHQSGQAQRRLTRSLWHMCNSSRHDVGVHSSVKPAAFTKRCGCCGLHTQGDKDLAEFLSEEIELERKIDKTPGNLPKIQGFELETKEANVTFTKSTDNEIVKVKFSINDSVADESPFDYEKPDEEQDVQMVSRPPFVVEINKGGEFTLCIECVIPDLTADSTDDPSPQEQQAEDQFVDVIEIQEIALVKGEWEDDIYSVSASVMDGHLYEMMLNMLEERGIDADFVQKLVEVSTAYEHKKYIGFLEQLKNFALSK